MGNIDQNYGKELILDLHNCDETLFSREKIGEFLVEICDLIDMNRADLHWWDDLDLPDEERDTKPHLKGTSAIQFITTSNLTIHTLDILKNVYINLFSCKEFDAEQARDFAANYFKGEVAAFHVIERK